MNVWETPKSRPRFHLIRCSKRALELIDWVGMGCVKMSWKLTFIRFLHCKENFYPLPKSLSLTVPHVISFILLWGWFLSRNNLIIWKVRGFKWEQVSPVPFPILANLLSSFPSFLPPPPESALNELSKETKVFTLIILAFVLLHPLIRGRDGFSLGREERAEEKRRVKD